ncbi:MAG: catalase family peroxidase [Halomonadaceae bacterium]|nr:MAG: catalase family peroxidase [Halomonadaceae bacterium]
MPEQRNNSEPFSPPSWSTTLMTLTRTLPGLLLIGSLAVIYPGTAAANPTQQVDALEALFGTHPGFRRGQAKGLCATGYFTGTEDGKALSTATAFNGDSHPVLARFSVGGGNPAATDQSRSARGLALKMTLPDREQWQMGNISAPLYFIAKPEHFAPFLEVRTPDPDTGEVDQEALAAFNEAHPETLRQAQWLGAQPIGGSYAGYTYWGVNAFRLTDADGTEQYVRWSFTPQQDISAPDESALGELGDDFLAEDLAERLQDGPVHFDFHLQLATDDNSLVDPTTIWPDSNPSVLAGKLTIEASSTGKGGNCDRMMFNPLALPEGVAASDDPVLHARPAAYGVSFGRRVSGE